MRHYYKLIILTAIVLNNYNAFSQAWKSYVPYNQKGLWGYADTSCKITIQPFTKLELGFFADNGIAITKDSTGKYGAINSAMKTVLQAKYKQIEIVNKQFLKVEIDDNNNQLFGLNGIKLLPFNFNTIVFDEEHPNDVLVFQKDDLLSVYKYDKKQKKMVFKRQHKNAGRAYFVGDKHYSVTFHYTFETKTFNLLTGKQEEIPELSDAPVRYDYDDVSIARIDDERFGSRNQPVSYPFTEIIPKDIRFEKEEKNYHNRNVMQVKLNGKWGVISYDRKVIVPIMYDSILVCANYSDYNAVENSKILAWICQLNNQYGIVCTDSNRNTKIIYERMFFFSSKYIMVKQQSKYGVLDRFGKTIIPCEVDSFQHSSSGSLNWSTCSDVLILFAIKGDKMALYDTKGAKTEYVLNQANDIYSDKISVYGYTRSIKLKSDSLYGLAICNGNHVLYIPCQFKELFYVDEKFYPELNGEIHSYRYFRVVLRSNQSGYIDQYGRKYFEE